jgi:hypothetical protein
MTKHIKNSNKNVINIHIHEKVKRKKRKHKKKRVHRETEGYNANYPIAQPYYPIAPQSNYPYGKLDNDKSAIKTNILDLIDARLKKFDQSHETTSSNLSNQVKQDHENTFFANEEGDVIPTEGSFLANIHVKRHDGKDHYLFHKVEPTLENQAKAVGIDEVITPIKKAYEKQTPFTPDEDHKIDTFDTDEESPTKALEKEFNEAIDNISNGNYDEPKSTNVSEFKEANEKSSPLFNMAGNIIGSVADNYIGLPTGTSAAVGGYILGGTKKKEEVVTHYEKELKEVNEESRLMLRYKKLKESFIESPTVKVTDEEWTTFKELAKTVGYSLKKTSNKKQKKSLILEKLINMESLVKEYDKKQIHKKKEIEEEKRKRRTPAGKANIHQIPQNQPTEALYVDKPVTKEQKSSSYFTTGNLVAGLGAIGTTAGVAYNVMGKRQQITPSNSEESLLNTLKKIEKEGTRKAIKKGGIGRKAKGPYDNQLFTDEHGEM